MAISNKQALYRSAKLSPGIWLHQAYELREAASKVDWLAKHPPEPNEFKQIGHPMPYRLLIALSIENLLKGLLVALKIRHEGIPPADKQLFTHKLKRLASSLVPYGVKFEDHEIELLEDMTPYIEWAGRYPFSKEESSYIIRRHDSGAHAGEIMLFQKLFDLLQDVGWISKGLEGQKGWHFLFTKTPVTQDQ